MTDTMNISQLSVQVPDEQEVSSLCYSSLSESSLSSNEEEKLKKVASGRYSRIAYTIQGGARKDEAEEVVVEARDDSPFPKAIITNDFNNCCNMQNEATKKAVTGRYSRLAFSVRQIGADKRK